MAGDALGCAFWLGARKALLRTGADPTAERERDARTWAPRSVDTAALGAGDRTRTSRSADVAALGAGDPGSSAASSALSAAASQSEGGPAEASASEPAVDDRDGCSPPLMQGGKWGPAARSTTSKAEPHPVRATSTVRVARYPANRQKEAGLRGGVG